MKTIHSLIAVSAITLAAAGAAAQTANKAPRVVSKDELRVCMNDEAALAVRRKDIDAKRAVNQTEQTAIRAEGQALAEDEKNVDQTNDRRVREFKRRVDTYNTRVKTANDALAAVRVELDGLNKSLIAYNESCAGISFLSEDKEAILKEREAAAKK